MNPATVDAIASPPAKPQVSRSGGAAGQPAPKRRGFPTVPALLTALLLAFTLCPRVNANPKLVWAFAAVAGFLAIWEVILWVVAKRRGQSLGIEFTPVASHYVQAMVQFSILLFWGWTVPMVYKELPLIAAQIVYLYAFEALITWSRGRTWRLGFGPLPIVISTNLLLWFRDDYFIFQFVMISLGALGKQFVTWKRDGRVMHIFNPSAFGQSIVALVLILTATTKDYTLGKEIAASFDTPHMLLVIFAGGLIVQYLFRVTLMTVAACATLVAINLIYTKVTGTYIFVNIGIAAPIFLGLHLLITDPSTSPHTNLGKVIFGVLYAMGYTLLFRLFDIWEVPLFWDKLLPVPVLNLCVPLIDRVVRSGLIGRLNQRWENSLSLGRMNLVHMGCWTILFGTLLATGFIRDSLPGDVIPYWNKYFADGKTPHPGDSIPFWKQAFADGKHHAGHGLVLAAGAQAEGGGSGAAYNELGLICMEGKIVKANHGTAAKYFAKAAELGDASGCANVAVQFLFLREKRSDGDVAHALDLLEKDCDLGGLRLSCYLVGMAYETGRGRPQDPNRAIEVYTRCSTDSVYACKGIARIALAPGGPRYDLSEILPTLNRAAAAGDAESLWYLAYVYHTGVGVQRDETMARTLLEKACQLGSQQACDALRLPEIPPYTKPVMVVPGWTSAYPLTK